MQLKHRLGALLQLHPHFFYLKPDQWIGQQKMQDETSNILVLEYGGTYSRALIVVLSLWITPVYINQSINSSKPSEMLIHINQTLLWYHQSIRLPNTHIVT